MDPEGNKNRGHWWASKKVKIPIIVTSCALIAGLVFLLNPWPLVWQRSWGKEGYSQYEVALCIWGDGNSIYVGGYGAVPSAVEDAIITKWDNQGNLLWNLSWGGSDFDRFNAIWANSTAIYACGMTASVGNGAFDLLLCKYDASGQLLWNATWGGSSNDRGYGIWGNDTAVYTCGETSSMGGAGNGLVLCRWAPNGTLLWNRTWGGSSGIRANALWGDSTYIYTCGECGGGLVLIKWDATGNQVWARTWWKGDYDDAVGLDLWGDANYLYTSGYSGEDLALLKWDKDGNLVWEKILDGVSRGNAIWGMNSNIYTWSTKGHPIPGSIFGWQEGILLKWDTDGNLVQNYTVGFPEQRGTGEALWGDGINLYSCGDGNHDFLVAKWSQGI